MICRWALATSVIIAASSTLLRARDVRVPDGTRVRVKLLQFISSETSRPGDPVRFEVAEDLRRDGIIVIRRGTPVLGAIVEASPFQLGGRRWLWWRRVRPGSLVFTATRTDAVDRQGIRLRSLENRQVRGQRPPLLRWSHEGEIFDAVIDGDYVIHDAVVDRTSVRDAGVTEHV